MTPTPSRQRPCGSCATPLPDMVMEPFRDGPSAFRRHAQLVQSGRAPSLCMRRDGTRYVCHLAGGAAAPAAAAA